MTDIQPPERNPLMADLAEFRTAVRAALRSGGDPAQVAVAVAAVGAGALPGDGGAITLMFSDERRQTLAATDAVMADIERAQLTVGEGPSLDAVNRGRPVLVSDLSASFAWDAWPGLSVQLADLDLGAMFAFPMRLGAAVVGAALCYRRRPGDLERAEVGFTLRAVDLVTLALLQLPGASSPEEVDGDWFDGDGLLGARVVHQATGMLMVQLGGVSSTAAFARMRAYAFANDRALEEVADEIVARQLVLEADPGPTT